MKLYLIAGVLLLTGCGATKEIKPLNFDDALLAKAKDSSLTIEQRAQALSAYCAPALDQGPNHSKNYFNDGLNDLNASSGSAMEKDLTLESLIEFCVDKVNRLR